MHRVQLRSANAPVPRATKVKEPEIDEEKVKRDGEKRRGGGRVKGRGEGAAAS